MNVNSKVRDWYMGSYPDDSHGAKISRTCTFGDIIESLNKGWSPFAAMEIFDDALIRIRVFAEIAEILGVHYDTIYEKWESEGMGKDLAVGDGGEKKVDGDIGWMHLAGKESVRFVERLEEGLKERGGVLAGLDTGWKTREEREAGLYDVPLKKPAPHKASDDIRSIVVLTCVYETNYGVSTYTSLHSSYHEALEHTDKVKEECGYEENVAGENFDFDIDEMIVDVNMFAPAKDREQVRKRYPESIDSQIESAKAQREKGVSKWLQRLAFER